MKISEFSVDKRVTITMMMLIVIVLGTIVFFDLGLDMLPDIEFPMVSVVTAYSGASPEDMESTVTKQVEQAIASVSGVKSLKSSSMEGVSVVTVEFESGTNLDFAAQDLRDQLAMFEDIFPEEIQTPLVVKFDISQLPILFYGVTSDEKPSFELAKYVEDNIAYRIERIDGVASVLVQSPEIREILVEVDRDALKSSGLDLNQLIQVLRFENVNLPAGRFIQDHLDFLVRTVAEFQNLEEIEELVVGVSPAGVPIQLRQIAKVKDTIAETRSLARIQRQNGVVMVVSKQSGANTVQVADRVMKELENIKSIVPKDVQFHLGMDQSESIRMMIWNTARAAILGGVLAMGLIYLFLRNIRPTLTIGLAIPTSIIATFIPIRLAGYTLNLLTLGGLALGIGMLVDNAVVVIENVFRHLEEGKRRRDAAKIGASEVGMAITASTLTTLAVFLPLSLGKGIAGQLSRGLALSISFAVLASLLVSLTIVPMIASVFFKKHGNSKDSTEETDESIFVKLKNRYSNILRISLRHRGKILASTGITFIISLVLILFVGTEFMPEMDRGMMMLKMSLPTGSSLQETNRVVERVEDILITEPSVSTVISSIGINESDRHQSAGGFSPTGSHEGVLMGRLVTRSDRDKSSVQILEEVRQRIPVMNEVKIEAIDLSSMMGGGGGSAVEIKILGKDFAVLKSLSDRVISLISDVEGLRDISSTLEKSKPEYHITLNREEINRIGLSSGQIASTIQASTLGKIATRYRYAGEETDVRVKFRDEDRNTLRDIQMLNLRTPQNTQIPLMQISSIERVEGPVSILRDSQTRVIGVTANIVDRDLGSIVQDIKKRLSGIEENLPEGYFIEFGGQYEQMITTFITLGQALALAILLVYMVMASQFESLVHPFVIMFTLPLALIGVIFGFLVTGHTISLPSFVGFIMLTGIVVNNGIVMVDYINQLRRKGMEVNQAIVQAASTRLRPILITALTTIFGMLPMAIGGQEGSEMRVPMAITVIGGLAFATVLTLFVIPSTYSVVDRFSFKANK